MVKARKEPWALKYHGGMTPPNKDGKREKITIDSAPTIPGLTKVGRRDGRATAIRKGLKRQLRRVNAQNPKEAERQASILGVDLTHALNKQRPVRR